MQSESFGFNLILTTKLSLVSTAHMEVVLKRPDSSIVTKTLDSTAFTAPAAQTDQPWKVSVPIEQGDLSMAGTYQIQLTDLTPGRKLPSAIGSFNVLPNI